MKQDFRIQSADPPRQILYFLYSCLLEDGLTSQTKTRRDGSALEILKSCFMYLF